MTSSFAQNRSTKRRYERLRSLGLCAICGKPNNSKFYYCEDCREKRKIYRKKYLDKKNSIKPKRNNCKKKTRT